MLYFFIFGGGLLLGASIGLFVALLLKACK